MSEGIADTVFEDVEVFGGRYPERVGRLKELLSKLEFVSEVSRPMRKIKA